ncbi:MAG: valine--tRNA ligase [Candidatus Beckwithbacteria bacterium]|nr:valine--tRNA ligase [Candidatus Beckwithbacteria bacterium]
MDKQYQPKEFEAKIYQMWEKSGAFKPTAKGKPYTIIMPPPNANDPLHVGHAMFVTIEDIFIRYHRMLGEATLWLPGTDHAGIETQYVFEKKLKKEGKSRFDFDRETLYQMIWDYVQKNKTTAIDQMKKLGASADWTKLKFTLDKDIVDQALDAFIKLYKDGLVYRGLRLVNYCTGCGTGFSNLEINHIERTEPLYYLKYGPFTLATTRPETKFGDTAVAVNPKDKRYQKWIGKQIEVEGLAGKFKLKVISDNYVDMKFGTGVVKITPAHDFNDYEVWQRHKNEIPQPKQVIDFNGKLNALAGKYQGMKINEVRKVIVEDLKQKGLMVKIDENYQHALAVCYRCGRTIEPLPMAQFFIKVKPLTKKVLASLNKGEVKIYGSGREKILRHWLAILDDWNISRQIVWGITIPVWYCNKKTNDPGQCFVVSQTRPKKCPKCGATEFEAETDTFDTWFSSSQWPFLTLRASPDKNDFERFYPTSLMETGYDILPIWVMRMLMMGLHLTEKVPFKQVYLHGLVRDEKGQKMSKSKGNAMNPLDVVEKYGADALRMALVMSTTAGQDSTVGEGKIRGMRNLTNKIWNATRYVLNMPEQKGQSKYEKELKENLKINIKTVTGRLNKLKPGQAAEWIYDWFWHTYCDRYIELAKKGLIGKKLMIEVLQTNLKLLHPFVPFVTEAVWQQLPGNKEKLLINSRWPK